MTIEEIKKLRHEMIKFCKDHNIPKPTVESMYNTIVETIKDECKTHELTWEQLSEKTGISMNRICYAFVEKYSTFHVRLKLDELLKICESLDINIGLIPIWLCGCMFARKE